MTFRSHQCLGNQSLSAHRVLISTASEVRMDLIQQVALQKGMSVLFDRLWSMFLINFVWPRLV